MYLYVMSTLALLKTNQLPQKDQVKLYHTAEELLAWSCPKIFSRAPDEESLFKGTIFHCSTVTSLARNTDMGR